MSAFQSDGVPCLGPHRPHKRQKVKVANVGGTADADEDLLAAYTSRAQDAIRLEFAHPSATPGLGSSAGSIPNLAGKAVLNSVAP